MIVSIDTNGSDASTMFRDNKHVLIDVKETREGCVLAIEPIALLIDDRPDDTDIAYDVKVDLDGSEHPFHITQRFAIYYSTVDNITLEIRQRLKLKHLVFQAPKPYIIKTCQSRGKER